MGVGAVRNYLFILEASIIPLFYGRSHKPMPLLKVVNLTLLALLFSICLTVFPFIISPEAVVSDSEVVKSQFEFVEETTSLPVTKPLDVPISSSLVFSIILGVSFYVFLLLVENFFIIFPLLIPFSFFERFFGFDLILPAVIGVGLLFAYLHSPWGFSVSGLAKLVPFSILLAYLTYEHGVLRASFAHLVYNFTAISISIAGVI